MGTKPKIRYEFIVLIVVLVVLYGALFFKTFALSHIIDILETGTSEDIAVIEDLKTSWDLTLLVNFFSAMFIGYAGVQGAFSFMKSSKMEMGKMAPLPTFKKTALFCFLIGYILLLLISLAVQSIYIEIIDLCKTETEAIKDNLFYMAPAFVMALQGNKLGANINNEKKPKKKSNKDSD